jgi:hypothetical protein
VEPSYCERQLFAGSLGLFYCYIDTKATYSVRGFFPVQRPCFNALLPAQFMIPIGYSMAKMSTFGIHRLDWLMVSKRFPWNAKCETVYGWLASFIVIYTIMNLKSLHPRFLYG